MPQIYVNGEFCLQQDAKISVTDRSYLFGEGVFESFRSYGGEIPFLPEHLKRLEWSATFLHLQIPANIDFLKICHDLLQINRFKNARFKIVLSRMDLAESSFKADARANYENNLVIFCEDYDESKGPQSLKLKLVQSVRNESALLASIKATNYLGKVIARNEASEAGFHDAILLNQKGEVTETTSANIFWVDENRELKTTPVASGILTGVMRTQLLLLLKENKIKITEENITAQKLSSMREVFVTNSVIGIKPVVAIDHRQLSGGEPGDVTLMLMDLWKKKVKEYETRPHQLH